VSAPLKTSDARRLAIAAIALTTAYAITARLGFLLAFQAEQVTTVWAPTGIAIAGLLLWGRRLWPAVWLGAFIANAGTSAPLWTAAAIATGNTLEAVIAVSFLRRSRGFDPAVSRLADAAGLIVTAAMLATTISATVGVATLCLAHVQPWSRFWSLWSAWWLGDALGALVVAPAILTTVRSVRNLTQPNWGNIGVLVVGCMAATQLLFGQTLGATFGEGLLHYLVFPLVVIAAVRFGQPATALVVLGVSAIAIWNTVRGAGPFASAEVQRGLILLQAFMAVLAGTGLMLAAAMSERLTGERRRGAASGIGELLAEATSLPEVAPAILRQVCDNLGWQIGGIWLVDPDVQQLRCSAVWSRAGAPAEPFERVSHQMLFPPGIGLPGRVWASGRAVWIEDVVKDPNFPRAPVADEAGVHGAFGFPIRIASDVVGVVEFFTRDVAAPDADLLVTMSSVGNQLGQFIARKRVENAIAQGEERFRTLAASNSALTLYEQDSDLRYRWVFPQHPEFPDYNIGKTDDELLPAGEGEALTALKRRVLETGVGSREEITVTLPAGMRSYDLMVEPRRDPAGAVIGVSGVAVDITERKRTEQLLRESEARLREADRHKDEFLAMLAHELRNPLAPIRTGLQFVRVADDPAHAVAQVLPIMERQVGHMVRLIDDLLDVSRISSGKIHLQRQPASLADIVNGAVEANRAAIEDAGIDLEIALPDVPLTLSVDPTRFVQVLSNLLNNATKFTDAGGTIAIRADVVQGETGADELLLSVTDTGIGIPREMLPRVFELFTQAEHTGHRAQPGLGIGLALVRRIVEMHDGRIDAHSDGAGTGSRFTIRMPLLVHEAERPAEERREADRGVLTRRVLIIDDNADAAEMMAALVSAMGGDAETASDGLDGIRRASAFAPDMIFLDIGMPVMDGYETCRRLRQEPFGRDVMIVALTGWGQERDKQRAAEAGFDAHLTKPADPAEIERLMSRGLADA
jgi:signal transduction histidine kinase/integral membrane sensor domain MASE1/ActR/RegA family two-component response regulator